MYKLAQITLVLAVASRSDKSSLPRLQLFNWGLKTRERQQTLVRAAESKVLQVHAWGFDPALTLALRLGVAEKLIEVVPTGYHLGKKGRNFAESILRDADLLVHERFVLQQIGKRLTEKMVESASDDWALT